MIKELKLDNGEEILWHQGQGTFHRGYDFELAVTNIHICLYIRHFSISPKWIKIPIEEVVSLEVSKPNFLQGLPGLLPMYVLLFGMLIASFPICYGKVSVSRFIGVTFWIGFIIYMVKGIWDMSKGRTHLKITTKNTVLGYTSDADGYQDTHEEDREIILGFVDAVERHTLGLTKNIDVSLHQ